MISPEKILFVDDDENVLAAYQRTLRKQYNIDTALGGAEGLEMIQKNGPYALIVADMNMPGMNGVEFLDKVQIRWPDIIRVMLTGNADQQTASDAINRGRVFRFITKPCPPEEFCPTLEAGLKQYRLVTAEKELLEKTLGGAIKVLLDVLSMVEPQSFGRAQRSRDYMRVFSKSYQNALAWELEIGAMMSSIGWLTLPASLLEKHRNGRTLTAAEMTLVTKIPEIGARLLSNIPRLDNIVNIVRYHTKNFDGSGLPSDGVRGFDIPIGARILRVISDLVELEYTGLTKSKALELMQKRNGCYDPRVLDAAFACFDVYLPHASGVQLCKLKELVEGQVLAADVMTFDDTLIATAGTKITNTLIEKLFNFSELSGIHEPIAISWI